MGFPLLSHLLTQLLIKWVFHSFAAAFQEAAVFCLAGFFYLTRQKGVSATTGTPLNFILFLVRFPPYTDGPFQIYSIVFFKDANLIT